MTFLRTLTFVLLAILSMPVFAQEDGGDEENPFETGTISPAPVPVGKFDEVKVLMNGKDTPLKDEISIPRNQTILLSIRQLLPGSQIIVHVEKTGVNVEKKLYTSNELGELDLEIQVPNKKIGATATVWYTPSAGKKIERKVKVKIE